MKNKSLFLSVVIAVFALASFTGCNKESKDLTTGIVGHYHSGSGSGAVDITVTKIDNNTISITLDRAATRAITFASTEMNSETTFTLNNVTETYADSRYDFSGSGSYSANNIVVVVHEKETEVSSGNVIYEGDGSYTGMK